MELSAYRTGVANILYTMRLSTQRCVPQHPDKNGLFAISSSTPSILVYVWWTDDCAFASQIKLFPPNAFKLSAEYFIHRFTGRETASEGHHALH